jgi:hypothetical protein
MTFANQVHQVLRSGERLVEFSRTDRRTLGKRLETAVGVDGTPDFSCSDCKPEGCHRLVRRTHSDSRSPFLLAVIAYQHTSCAKCGRANFLNGVMRQTLFESEALERFDQPKHVKFDLLCVCVAKGKGTLQGEQQE